MISDVCLAIWRQRSSVSFKNRSQMSIDTQAAPLQECGLPGRRLTFFSRLQTKARNTGRKTTGHGGRGLDGRRIERDGRTGLSLMMCTNYVYEPDARQEDQSPTAGMHAQETPDSSGHTTSRF